jgi:ribosomal subunit interface protein
MKIQLEAKNMELTPAIQDHVSKQVTNLEKLVKKIEADGGEVLANFKVAKTTNHHKGGEVFLAECSINIKGKNFYSRVDMEDLYQAINTVKENIFNEIQKNKDYQQTIFKRGAASIKKMLKGLSARNPLTGKY